MKKSTMLIITSTDYYPECFFIKILPFDFTVVLTF